MFVFCERRRPTPRFLSHVVNKSGSSDDVHPKALAAIARRWGPSGRLYLAISANVKLHASP